VGSFGLSVHPNFAKRAAKAGRHHSVGGTVGGTLRMEGEARIVAYVWLVELVSMVLVGSM
jgi:hypothetical protein